MEQCDYIIAFNKQFDENILRSNFAKYNLVFPATPWICGLYDIPYPPEISGKRLKLKYLLTEHEIEITKSDYASMHTALGDCKLILKILELYSWPDILDYIKSAAEKITVKSLEPYERKEDVKAAGFRWNKDQRLWLYECRPTDLKNLEAKWKELNIETQVMES